MPRPLKLTQATVDRLLPPARGQRLYYDSQLRGFGVRVGITSKAYFAEWRVGGRAGRTVRKTIGRHGAFTPDQARTRAMALLSRMQLGEDPFVAERRARVQRVSLAQAHAAFLAARKALKPTTVRDYDYCYQRYFADWHDKPLSAITRELVAERHTLIGKKGVAHLRSLKRAPLPSPAKANLALRYLRAVFNFALYRYEPHLTHNPVRHLSLTRAWYPLKPRQRYLKEHELKPWFKAVLALENDPQTQARERARDYLLFLLFTGLRRTEAARLQWSHVDLKARTVSITETKNREPHTLPLPDYLVALLARRRAQARAGEAFVFPGEGRAGHLIEPRKQVLRVCAAAEVEFRLHDLRRTFATVAERLDIPHYALKRLLNHKMRNDVTAGYIIAEVERLRAPMQKIADFFLRAARG